jgi:drug/metabolite transporter (DMT)-like permease
MLLAFITALLFAASAFFGNRGTRILGATPTNFYRLIMAAVVLGVWAHLFGGGLHGRTFYYFFISGMIGFGLGDYAYFQALPRIGARLSVLIVQCGAVPMAVIMEWLWVGTTIEIQTLLCSLVILTGVVIALAPSDHQQIPFKLFIPGILFGLVGAFGQALGAVVSRKAFLLAESVGENVDGITSAYQRLLGGLLVIGIIYFLGKTSLARLKKLVTQTETPDAHFSKTYTFFILLANALTGAAIGVSCYQLALKTAPTGIVLSIVATTPILIIPFSKYMDGEKIKARSVAGSMIAVLGVIALYRFKH